MLSGMREQADSVKRGDRKRRGEKEPRHVSCVLAGEAAAKPAIENHGPEEQAYS